MTTEQQPDVLRCEHGIRHPWQCADCDTANLPPQPDVPEGVELLREAAMLLRNQEAYHLANVKPSEAGRHSMERERAQRNGGMAARIEAHLSRTPPIAGEARVDVADREYSDEALTAGMLDFLDRKADAWMAETSVERMFHAIGSVFANSTSPEIMQRFNEKMRVIGHQCFVEGAYRAWEDISRERRGHPDALPLLNLAERHAPREDGEVERLRDALETVRDASDDPAMRKLALAALSPTARGDGN